MFSFFGVIHSLSPRRLFCVERLIYFDPFAMLDTRIAHILVVLCCILDGKAAEVTPTQKKWTNARLRAQERAAQLHKEMIALHKEWEELDELAEKAAASSEKSAAQ